MIINAKFWLFGIIMTFFVLLPRSVGAQETSVLTLYYGIGCPHCANVEEYIHENGIAPAYEIERKEIYQNRSNAEVFSGELDRLGIPLTGRGVPTMIYGERVIVGDGPIIVFLKNLPIEPTLTPGAIPPTPAVEETKMQTGLTLAAVVAGALVDAINPCEFAVLIILMTTILATGSSKKALFSGLAFSLSIFLSYFLMGLGLFTALDSSGLSAGFYRIIGWVAIVLGLFNLKDWMWYGKGFLMEVPLSWRPSLKKLIHSVTSPVGAFFTGFLVSLFLLPCTSGPYIVILGMLAKNVYSGEAIRYLALYNLIFVSPMLVITWLVYKGFDPAHAEEIRQKRLRALHLIAGIVLLAMGIAIVGGLF